MAEETKPGSVIWNAFAGPFGGLAKFWRSSSVARMAVPVLCLCYDVMMLTRIVFAGPGADPQAGVLTRQPWGLPLMVVLCLISVGALLVRLRRPFVAACVVCAAYLCAALFGMEAYMALPMLFALYSCTLLCVPSLLVVGITVNAAVLVSGALLHMRTSVEPWAILLPMAFLDASVIALGLCSRGIRERREAKAVIEDQRRRGVELERQRDEARRRTDIAAELHDSVGHDLTAIIALTEGLGGMSGDPQIDEAIATVNELARSGLADTRQAVCALQNPDASPVMDRGHSTFSQLHTWNDVAPILSHAKQLGFIVAHTETGYRPDDPRQADLCFTVTREAVTNAIRHARNLRRIVISWDHADNGSLTVIVRDDGASGNPEQHDGANDAATGTGMGLNRLGELVAAAGGSFEAGPDNMGYMLKAVMPSMQSGRGNGNGRHEANGNTTNEEPQT
ncbi:sensor histidine kinase [Bifidobacterium scardovii]|uniref:histidine kinase n=1 Tax=Bifidobacterium scardovii TaxID=158787 RepID=A0A087DAK1_9BIFI|nr:histidine kinase [Bifidobacterium scardovii]KFI92551.1 histidine kinase [Bifidobacterium scardovii]MDK6349039.1 histidine kinase [Bifidobacterium scardovii]MDU8981246.1 histidine kinase [Bifidobacterium scardovii]BAQ31224.1 putative two-component sensor kinase [Bifidobacterium scardovii JCM 12489 = DSM 13734]